ncbi:Haus3: HAUS augmin-like complex subunit 3 [Crotalus adamanteus]|uniref:Haus3: HAUS augmin-like complex subunit 3 n=1 Tax=Crotalus adamanteus TaxID=8729 RepID=A0AAW1BPD4_CROAD
MDNLEFSNIWNGTTPSRPNQNAKFRSATGYILAKILQLILDLDLPTSSDGPRIRRQGNQQRFCNTLGEENVLTPTELEAYEKLVISGKPTLEGKALEKVLRTCGQFFQLNNFEEQLLSKNKPEFKQKDLLEKIDQPTADYFKSEGLPIQDFFQKRLKTQKEIGQTKHFKNMGSYREELEHMELTYLGSKTVMTTARITALSSILQKAEEVLKVTKENKVKEEKSELSFCVTRCQEQLCILQSRINKKTQLPVPLLQSIAYLVRLPTINGELDLENMRLEYLEYV